MGQEVDCNNNIILETEIKLDETQKEIKNNQDEIKLDGINNHILRCKGKFYRLRQLLRIRNRKIN